MTTTDAAGLVLLAAAGVAAGRALACHLDTGRRPVRALATCVGALALAAWVLVAG